MRPSEYDTQSVHLSSSTQWENMKNLLKCDCMVMTTKLPPRAFTLASTKAVWLASLPELWQGGDEWGTTVPAQGSFHWCFKKRKTEKRIRYEGRKSETRAEFGGFWDYGEKKDVDVTVVLSWNLGTFGVEIGFSHLDVFMSPFLFVKLQTVKCVLEQSQENETLNSH